MIRKIGVLGISLLCFAAIVSCEKDFNDIGSNVVSNTKFETGEILLDVEITPIDIESVRADNLELGRFGAMGALGEYWLGGYNNENYKAIEASIVSQLTHLTNPKTEDIQTATEDGQIDSLYVLDRVVLKLPYTVTDVRAQGASEADFRFDSILGNTAGNKATLKVFRNNTFLSSLDPDNITANNSFESNQEYEITDPIQDILNENTEFKLNPTKADSIFVFDRHYSNGDTFKDTIRLSNKAPFLAIPLNTSRMKNIFWDKFKDVEFSSPDEFSNYFRGLIIQAEGTEGVMAPFTIAGASTSASLEFYYTITRYEKQEGQTDLVYKDTVPSNYSFPLSGFRNSIYKMSPAVKAIPDNNFVVQGTAGTMAEVKILDNAKVQELRANNWLINDAALSFYINQTVNADKNIIPQKLLLYQSKGYGENIPVQLSDTYREPATYGGILEASEEDENIPEKYTFRITDYISDLLNGENETTADPLILKVFNDPTDSPVNPDGALDTSVKTYNWNPRGVTLLDGNEAANGAKRAVLKITYSKEK